MLTAFSRFSKPMKLIFTAYSVFSIFSNLAIPVKSVVAKKEVESDVLMSSTVAPGRVFYCSP